MLLVSRFRPDATRFAEWIACLWQGPAPPGAVVRSWYYLGTEPREMLLIWDAVDDDGRGWVEGHLAPFGELDTWSADDATPGMDVAFRRDLGGFAEWLTARGAPAADVERQVALRRAGMESADWAAAAAAARAWAASA